MRRRFSTSERVALYLYGGGSCPDCGETLEPGWHADHEIPFADGGATAVENGQALCPRCNIRKGKSLPLRTWQERALTKYLRSTQDDFLVVAVPGSGKTRLSLAIARELLSRHEIQRLVVVVPTSHLRSQWAKAASSSGIELDSRFDNGAAVLAADFDGVAATYAAVCSQPALYRKLSCDVPTLVVLDEVHHGGDKLSWGEALKQAFTIADKRLLLSGTPIRTDGSPVPFVTYTDDGHFVADVDYSYGAALRDRVVVRPIEFNLLDGNVRWRSASQIRETSLREADEDARRIALRTAYDPAGSWMRSVLEEADTELTRHRHGYPDAGGLVVASDQLHARRYATMLRSITGEDPTIAISDEPRASESIQRFASDSSRWIVAVQMVSEGVDIPRLAVGVYASKTTTELFFRQVVGRFVRMRSPQDETTATLFIPKVEPLVSFAQQVETTIQGVLAEQGEEGEGDRGREFDQPLLPGDFDEPLDSSEAVHTDTIFSGEIYDRQLLQRVEAVASQCPALRHISPAALAQFQQRLATSALPDESPEHNQEEPQFTKAQRKEALRRAVQKKVGRLSILTDSKHAHINADLNSETGDTARSATEESLQRRLNILDRKLREVQS